MNVVIPMAGLGQRFKDQGFSVTKPLIDICGTPMIVRVIESLQIKGNYTFILRNQDELAKLKDVLLSTTKIYPNFIRSVKFLTIDYLTDGPASTVLVAKDLINTNEPLVVANCDQIMWWNGKLFQTFCKLSGYDGVVVTYYSNSTKNSYAKINRKMNIWEFETHGQEYCRANRYNCLYTNHVDDKKRGMLHWDSVTYPYIATAIYKGKWVTSQYPDELKVLFSEYGIDPAVRGEI